MTHPMHVSLLAEALTKLDGLSAPPPAGKPSLLGLTADELVRFAQAAGEPAYRGRQLFEGLYRHKVRELTDMTNLGRALRDALAGAFTIERPRIDRVEVATDGVRKYRLLGGDGAVFEAVYLPEVAKGSRTHTLCISSQTGCAVGCRFCFTASLKRNRNLLAAEIVGQVLAVQDDIASLGTDAPISNIVFMGMGEPLLNYAQVVRAIRIFTEPRGLGFVGRRITVSTSGIVPRIAELGRDVDTQLAISLNATTDEVRSQIMPINRTWGLHALLDAMRAYPLPRRRRITVEYVLLGGVNDSLDDARRLPKLLRGIPVKVNLLPLNPHARTELVPPAPEQVARFQHILRQSGMNAMIRTPRGQDIAAACGQLGETVRGTP